MSRLRILHVITRLEAGGAQRNTLYTVEHLDRQHFSAALAWGPGDVLDGRALQLDDVDLFEIADLVRPVAPSKDLRGLSALRRVIRAIAPDVVHTHSSKAGILGRLAARIEGVPATVHSIHGFGFTPLQPAPIRALFFLAEKIAAPWTDHFIAVSRRNLELGLELGLFVKGRASIIRSGIETERFTNPRDVADIRRSLEIPASAPVITQIGNFKAQKAPLDFVRAAAAVAGRFPDARFVMVGEGPLRPAAKQLAHELGLASSIVFCGWMDDIPSLLAATDVSVLSSRHEGLPRAVVESLIAGVPVVATDVDGTSEVLHDGVNGFLAEAGNVTVMADRVCRLLADPGLRQRLAAAAPKGLGEFDIDLMVRQQEELYTCLLGPNRS